MELFREDHFDTEFQLAQNNCGSKLDKERALELIGNLSVNRLFKSKNVDGYLNTHIDAFGDMTLDERSGYKSLIGRIISKRRSRKLAEQNSAHSKNAPFAPVEAYEDK